MKYRIPILLILSLLFGTVYAQSKKEIYILVKQQKGKAYKCPSQDVKYKIHQLNSKLSYEKKKKALKVFKDRLKGNDDNTVVDQYTLYIKPTDYLVFYEYRYRYSEKKYPECSTNVRMVYKVIVASDPQDFDTKLRAKLSSNSYKNDYVSHNIIDIRQPFVTQKNTNLLDKLRGYIKNHLGNKQNIKVDATGIRG